MVSLSCRDVGCHSLMAAGSCVPGMPRSCPTHYTTLPCPKLPLLCFAGSGHSGGSGLCSCAADSVEGQEGTVLRTPSLPAHGMETDVRAASAAAPLMHFGGDPRWGRGQFSNLPLRTALCCISCKSESSPALFAYEAGSSTFSFLTQSSFFPQTLVEARSQLLLPAQQNLWQKNPGPGVHLVGNPRRSICTWPAWESPSVSELGLCSLCREDAQSLSLSPPAGHHSPPCWKTPT